MFVLTGSDRADDIAVAAGLHADNYLGKPLNPDELRWAIGLSARRRAG